MDDNLRRRRLSPRDLAAVERKAAESDRDEPLSPQVFWIAGILLLLFAEALIFGGQIYGG